MKKILLIFAILFSASFVDARSVRVSTFLEDGIAKIIFLDSQNKNKEFFTLIVSNNDDIHVVKNEKVLTKLKSYMNGIFGIEYKYEFEEQDVYGFGYFLQLIETHFLLSNFQLTFLRENKPLQELGVRVDRDYYFYKQD